MHIPDKDQQERLDRAMKELRDFVVNELQGQVVLVVTHAADDESMRLRRITAVSPSRGEPSAKIMGTAERFLEVLFQERPPSPADAEELMALLADRAYKALQDVGVDPEELLRGVQEPDEGCDHDDCTNKNCHKHPHNIN